MIELLKKLLNMAVAKCYAQDNILIVQSMEQASVARIFYYMQELINTSREFNNLKNYNLDCEYNKKGKKIKETPRCLRGTRPDLILHKRGTNNDNLLIVEFKSRKASYKKHINGKWMDFVKLEDFTSPYIYNYKLGIFVQLHKRKPKYTYFTNGEINSELNEGE